MWDSQTPDCCFVTWPAWPHSKLWWSNWRLYKNVKTAETVADWLHPPDWELTQAQSTWPGPRGGSGVIMTNTGHCTDNNIWWDTGDCQGSLLHCSWSRASPESSVDASLNVYIRWSPWTDVASDSPIIVTTRGPELHGAEEHTRHQIRTERRPPFD